MKKVEDQMKIKKAAPEGADQLSEDQVNSDIITMDDNAVKYDVGKLRRFIDNVFHTPHAEDQNIWTQLSPKAPRGFGNVPEMVIRNTLSKTQAPMRG